MFVCVGLFWSLYIKRYIDLSGKVQLRGNKMIPRISSMEYGGGLINKIKLILFNYGNCYGNLIKLN